jgi:O-antigen/teichoic acid export membrane protein
VSLPDAAKTALEASQDFSRMARVQSAKASVAIQVEAGPTAAMPGALRFITRGRLRAWGWLSVLSLVDQGLASGAGFGVNLLLARWMAAEVYGGFAVAFAGFLFVAGFYNVLLLEPMSVMGPSRYAGNLPAYFRAQIRVHAILVGTMSGVSLLVGLLLWRVVPASPLIGAVMGAGLALPFLLLTWLSRRMCYVTRRPGLAILGSGFYLGFVCAGLFALAKLGWLNSFSAFALMGCGSLLSGGLLLWRFGLLKEKSAAVTRLLWLPTLQENWTYGKWLIGSALLNPAVSQGQIFFVAAFLGLGAAGVLRAMQLPSFMMTQAITATGLLFLPVFSGEYGRGAIERLRHKATLLSLALAGTSLCFALFLALFSSQLEEAFFAGKYAAYAWLTPILALVPVVSAFSIGYSMALRASQKPQFDLLANIIAAPIALLSAMWFIRRWGLAGAASSMVLGFLVLGAVSVVCFQKQK